MSSAEKPIELLQRSLNSIVLIKLKGGREIRGKLRSFDQHMNLVLEEAEEFRIDDIKSLGKVIVRGDNVILISPPPR
jgi:small nuclear ribonucleoprotein